MVYMWLALMIAFLAVEAGTAGLVSLWFAGGSLVALIAAAAHAPVWLQAALFIVVSGAILILLRPVARRYLDRRKKPTNADRILGMVCSVTEDIDNIRETGAVYVDGKTWSARSAGGETIPAGSLVRPVAIQGVKLIVGRVQPASTEEKGG
jgi:membrane protein implicated in regulation of membrane protease activity